ncbi:MAG: PQQ-dependent sugar dehydrogenase [Trueperaceae bacterium]|nr:PQQ-dependent sugar dehydrogenase [Trueperaceae bacterium]
MKHEAANPPTRQRTLSSKRWFQPAALLLAGLLLSACAAAQGDGVELEVVADGLASPVGVTTGPNGHALYVLEQGGTVRVVEDGTVRPEPFVDISKGDFRSGGEQGLLGLAFHPNHPSEVFVHYTDAAGGTVLSRMPVREGRAVPGEETRMLTVAQPYGNHNGGQLAVGPDGMLYMALGDGGSGGDPHGHGQNPNTLLGTLLRLDPGGDPVAIPPDNPFADGEDGAPEVWHYGLRNPWRFSFDPATGDLWIADVGQNRTEEVNRVAAGGEGGLNFGWNVMEGDRCYADDGCDPTGTVLPVVTYDHADGWGRSVTGGHMYRGSGVPSLRGAYVFGDYVGGTLLVARRTGDDTWQAELLLDAGFPVSSLGVDADGEVLITDHDGRLLRIVAP